MLIQLYRTGAETNRVDKALDSRTDLVGTLIEACDILNPVIKVNYSQTVLNMNYCYIDAFKRYYFITDMNIKNGVVYLSLHVDVLMTYKDDIKKSTGHIIRSASNPNYYITDNMVTKQTDVQVYTRRIGEGFTRADKYLITIGG